MAEAKPGTALASFAVADAPKTDLPLQFQSLRDSTDSIPPPHASSAASAVPITTPAAHSARPHSQPVLNPRVSDPRVRTVTRIGPEGVSGVTELPNGEVEIFFAGQEENSEQKSHAAAESTAIHLKLSELRRENTRLKTAVLFLVLCFIAVAVLCKFVV